MAARRASTTSHDGEFGNAGWDFEVLSSARVLERLASAWRSVSQNNGGRNRLIYGSRPHRQSAVSDLPQHYH